MRYSHKKQRFRIFVLFLMLILNPGFQVLAEESRSLNSFIDPVEVNGFIEVRAGCRTQEDPCEKDISVMEARFQGELSFCTELVEFRYKGDIRADGITEEKEYDTREACFFIRPSDFADIKIGRQVLTWGTGELVFLNDLFPKDWQSFFIGRNSEYLKAPSDAVKLGFFTSAVNMDFVYTPKFDHDRYVTGEYLSYWNNSLGRLAGRDSPIEADMPDNSFEDDEVAVRIYRTIGNYELAIYGYDGFWKRPAGQTLSGRPSFPGLCVLGSSLRGQVGRGIGNIELARYESVDDKSGSNPFIDNSEMRYLIGYTQEMAKDFCAGIQYYVEQMLDYRDYTKKLSGGSPRDDYRHVITLQLTRLMMNQNLEILLSAYYSPSDNDAYFRPGIKYKCTDRATIEAGANVFRGDCSHTFFAQFEKNTNVYASFRYSF